MGSCAQYGSGYSILKKDGEEEIEMANSVTVMVCYDCTLKKSIEIPGRWRKWLGE